MSIEVDQVQPGDKVICTGDTMNWEHEFQAGQTLIVTYPDSKDNTVECRSIDGSNTSWVHVADLDLHDTHKTEAALDEEFVEVLGAKVKHCPTCTCGGS